MRKSIIVYYSWSGRTREIAKKLAAQTGAELLELQPQTPYTENYSALVKQARAEIQAGSRPALRPIACDLAAYDTVFVGTPIWCGTMAPPVAAFLSANPLAGKTVFPFSTHGGGGKGDADQDIAALCPDAAVLPMYTAYEGGGRRCADELAAWLRCNDF